MKSFFAALVVSSLTATLHQAQLCTENGLDGFTTFFPYGSGGNGSTIGQSFTACDTGVVTSITINEHDVSTAGDYLLWMAPESGGANTAYTGGPAMVIGDPGGAFPRLTTLVLSTPFPVTSGSSHRFVLERLGSSRSA